MNKKQLALLRCPRCKGELVFQRRQKELHCLQDRLAFPVRKGVPVLLEQDARKLDDSTH